MPRKPSLIKEESLDDDYEDDGDMDMEIDMEMRAAKSAESLDDNTLKRTPSHTLSPSHRQSADVLNPKRPLVSVASSPQLLNQICEEHESDEEDDFVPMKLAAPRFRLSRNSAASPEMIRKYEQRKKRGSGSRGTSCSSSDASDTDDTEGRSRKDKLKHKYVYRRDSSDHSSDTDGGPSGPSAGLGGGFGGGGGNTGHSKDRRGNGRGGGKDQKDGNGGSGGNQGGKRHGRSNHNLQLSAGKNKELNLALSNLTLSSVVSKTSLKYIVERSESDSDIDDALSDRITDKNDNLDDLRNILKAKENKTVCLAKKNCSDHVEGKHSQTVHKMSNSNICSADCSVNGIRERTVRHKVRVKMDINRNGYCKENNHQLKAVTVQTKCCSVV